MGGILLHDLSRPERVIGQDQPTGADKGEDEIIVGAVVALIRVDVDQVKRLGPKLGEHPPYVVPMGVDLHAVRVLLPIGAEEWLHLVVNLHRVDFGVRVRALCQTERGVAGIGADLQQTLRAHHAAAHLQCPPLQVTGNHARPQQFHVRVSVEASQQRRFCVRVIESVGLDLFSNGHVGVGEHEGESVPWLRRWATGTRLWRAGHVSRR